MSCSIRYTLVFAQHFSTTSDRAPKRNPTKVKVATKKTKDYDDNFVKKHWTIFARYVSNHIPAIFITILYTLVLIAIFAERAYCK